MKEWKEATLMKALNSGNEDATLTVLYHEAMRIRNFNLQL